MTRPRPQQPGRSLPVGPARQAATLIRVTVTAVTSLLVLGVVFSLLTASGLTALPAAAAAIAVTSATAWPTVAFAEFIAGRIRPW